jgi:hypothetical protein
MNAKARDLTLLAAVSLFFAMITWAGDRDILGSAFFALGASRDLGRSSAAPALTWMRKRRTRLRSSPSLAWASY